MSVIRWEDPPPAYANQTGKKKYPLDHELTAYQLRKRPGEWAVVFESPSINTLASFINRGQYAPYRPAGSFEATSRLRDGKFVIYARYVGEGDA